MPASGRLLPFINGSFGSISTGQGPPRELVRSYASKWSSRMQVAGQVHAITQHW